MQIQSLLINHLKSNKMLTQNQKLLIENLEREFTKLNKPLEKNTNRLINKADIDNRLKESDNIIAELKALENASNEAIKEMIERDMARLNQDLREMGLVAYKKHEFTITIDTIDNYNMGRGYYSKSLTYEREQWYSSLPNGNTHKHQPKLRGICCYLNPHKADYFESIDKLCADNRFIRIIEGMYSSRLKK